MQKNLFIQSLRDFFTADMLKISALPFVISIIVMYILFFSAADMGLDSLENTALHIETTQTNVENGISNTKTEVTDVQGQGVGETMLRFLMTHTITSWLVSFFVYTIGGIFTLLFSVMIAVIVIGFLTPYILTKLQKKHYPSLELKGFAGAFESTLHLLKSLFIMVLLIFVLSPLYFIPLLNIVAFNLPFYYFFHKMINYDVGGTICTKEEFITLNALNKSKIRFVTLTLFLLSLIPFLALFGSVFFIIYLGHNYFSLLEVRRLENHRD